MADYRKLYYTMFNSIEDLINSDDAIIRKNQLIEIQQNCEAMFMEFDDVNITKIDFFKNTNQM